MALSHRQAEDLIQAALDGLLDDKHRLELKRHLADCHQCQAYAENLAQMDSWVSNSLKERWPEPSLSARRMAQVAATARLSADGKHRRGWLLQVIQPVAWVGALVLLVLIIGGVLEQFAARRDSEIAPSSPLPSNEAVTGTAFFATLTPTLSPESVRATMTPSASAVPCQIIAQAEGESVSVYSQPGASGDMIGRLANGEIATIINLYGGDSYTTWLQITFNGSTGWIRWSDDLAMLSDLSCTIPIITATP